MLSSVFNVLCAGNWSIPSIHTRCNIPVFLLCRNGHSVSSENLICAVLFELWSSLKTAYDRRGETTTKAFLQDIILTVLQLRRKNKRGWVSDTSLGILRYKKGNKNNIGSENLGHLPVSLKRFIHVPGLFQLPMLAENTPLRPRPPAAPES